MFELSAYIHASSLNILIIDGGVFFLTFHIDGGVGRVSSNRRIVGDHWTGRSAGMGGLRQSLPALVAGRLTALPAGSCRLVRYLQRAQPLARRSGSLTSRAAKAGARRSPPAPQARWRPSGCGCRTARSGGCPRPPRSRWGPSSVRDGGLVLEGRVQAECRRVPGRRDVGGYSRQKSITMFRYA